MMKARLSHRSTRIPKKSGVTICGKQPKSNIWAVTSDLYINELTGMLIIIFMYLVQVQQKFIGYIDYSLRISLSFSNISVFFQARSMLT